MTMSNYECRLHSNKYPSEGEIIVGKVSSIDNEGVMIDLVEYGDAKGLILLGELSKKRIKNIQQITKLGNIEFCNVLRVDEKKGYIDLSLSKVSENEKNACKENYGRNKLSYHIMLKAAKRLDISVKNLYEDFGYKKEEEFGSLYYFFARVKDNNDIIPDDDIGLTIKKLIKEQFQASTYKVRADVDIVCPNKGGVESMKEAYNEARKFDSKIEISLMKTPTYSIVRTSGNKEKAFVIVNTVCEIMKKYLEAVGGSLTIFSAPKLYGEKSRYSLLSLDENVENEISSDE